MMLNTLEGLGLSQTDSQIYVCLASEGPRNRKEIMATLSLGKHQLYHSLKQLLNKGLIYMSLSRPVTFYAVPLEQALNSLLEKENKQAENLERNRETILSYWRNLTSNR